MCTHNCVILTRMAKGHNGEREREGAGEGGGGGGGGERKRERVFNDGQKCKCQNI